ncbi:hypothetical protein DPD11_19715 [Salmonella enterica subsp. salamae]|nr:hypothetical protein [Salmonella enterica]ECI4073224.1 hypothetical protein [Salmonella enterica subsp. salamae]
MNPASAGFFVFCSFSTNYPARVSLLPIGDTLVFICRYSVTNNVLIYNHFIKDILFCLHWATR